MNTRTLSTILLTVALFAVAPPISSGQSYIYSTGYPTFTTASPVEGGFVDVANGNLHLEIPIISVAERGGTTYVAKLTYDSRIWQPLGGAWQPTNVFGSTAGWQLATLPASGGIVNYNSTAYSCNGDPGQRYRTYQNFRWRDLGGTVHFFPISTQSDPTVCNGGDSPSDTEMATDSTGYQMVVTNFNTSVVRAPDGSQVYPSFKDSNGNYFQGSWDTLGHSPVTTTVNGSQTYYDVLNAQGSTSRFTLNTGTVYVSTSFGQPGVSEQTNYALTMVTSFQLPDGSSYQFGYDGYGELNSITLPTGGQISYSYTNFSDAYQDENRWVNTYSAGGGTWTFTPTGISSSVCTAIQNGPVQGCHEVIVQKPSNEQIKYIFSLNGGAWDSETDYYNASGTPVGTTQQIVNLGNTCGQCTEAAYVQKTTNYTKMPTVNSGTLTSQTIYNYDSIYDFNVTSVQEWNFTTGSFNATPDRETDATYTSGNGTYNAANILNRPTQVKHYAGSSSGTLLAQTNYSYDSTALTLQTGVVSHDDTNYGTGNTVRGTLTQTQQWISGSSYWTTTLTYDTTGQLVQTQDNKGNVSSISYNDSYYNDNGANPPASTSAPSGPTNAYATQITRPIIGAENPSYYLGTGQLAFSTDQNSATTYFHYVDSFSRPTQINDPIGGWQLIAYTSQTQQDIYTALTSTTPSASCTSCRHDQILLDNLGRVTNTPLVNDPDGQINAITNYDTNSRVSSSTNPYRSTSDSTYGSTSMGYDGLDRVVSITRPDVNVVNNTYGASLPAATSSVCGVTAFPSVTTDEAGKKRQYWTDAFGRLLEVDEPDSGGNFSIATCYQYDMLDRLATATQRGGDSNSANWRNRYHYYDGLSRVTQVTTPEAGTTTYSFVTGGNPCSGDPSLPCSRTDARNITTTYTYDALNRLTATSYSDSTPAVAYYYDQTSYNGLTITNGKGRRTGMSDGTGQTAWSYDGDGNILTKRQTIAGVTNVISYIYNLNSSVQTMATPNGHTYTYGYSNALRPVSLVDNGNGYTYAQNTHYAAPGLLTSAQHGLNLGITETNSFNNRLEPTLLSAAGGQTVLSLSYSWVLPGNVNNGSVYQINNNRDSSNNRSLQYSYDQLNRLQTAGTVSGASSPWTTTYGYDNWGNLLQKSTSGPGEPSMGPIMADVHNHVNPSGYTYDAAGNLTFDGVNNMSYDAENRLTPTYGGWVYSYDGDGHRVEKNYSGTITYYWYDDNFKVISTTGNYVRDYVYFNGRRVAYYSPSSGNQHYYWSDHLGSERTMSNSSGGTIEWEADYYPFGGHNVLNNGLDNFNQFTDYEYDYELGDSYADFREQSPVLGRFFSPDQVGANIADPSSLNAYAYVGNDPCNWVDPFGLKAECYFDIHVGNLMASDSELTAAEQRMQALFQQAGVGVNFVSGMGDYNISIGNSGASFFNQYAPNPPGVTALSSITSGFGATPSYSNGKVLNYGFVFADRILGYYANVSSGSLGYVLGTVAAHEAGHYFLGRPGSIGGEGLMSHPNDPLSKANFFSKQDAQKLQEKCNQLHPTGGAGGGGGGGGGPDLSADLGGNPFGDIDQGGLSGSNAYICTTVLGVTQCSWHHYK